jgi:hypothetical protein
VREFVVYTLARLGVFVGSYAVIVGAYLLVTGDTTLPILWPLLVAVVASGVVSAFLLKNQRKRFAAVVERRAAAASARFEAARSKEDEPDR